MPCTTILVGKKASLDGSTIIARNDDGGFEPKRVLVHAAKEKPSTYKTVISHLSVELPGNALRYTDCPDVVTKNSGHTGGADTKFAAAMELGLELVIIDRPKIEYDAEADCNEGVLFLLKKQGI